MIRYSIVASAALIAAMALVLTGCSASGTQTSSRTETSRPHPVATAVPTPQRDAAALTQLRAVAAASAAVDGTVTNVDCWMPSEHMIGGSAPADDFGVLCRVHYDQKSTKRYKDMRCIGDFDETPMLTSCYRWAFHAGQPRFEDGDALASSSPTPTPTR